MGSVSLDGPDFPPQAESRVVQQSRIEVAKNPKVSSMS